MGLHDNMIENCLVGLRLAREKEPGAKVRASGYLIHIAALESKDFTKAERNTLAHAGWQFANPETPKGAPQYGLSFVTLG